MCIFSCSKLRESTSRPAAQIYMLVARPQLIGHVSQGLTLCAFLFMSNGGAKCPFLHRVDFFLQFCMTIGTRSYGRYISIHKNTLEWRLSTNSVTQPEGISNWLPPNRAYAAFIKDLSYRAHLTVMNVFYTALTGCVSECVYQSLYICTLASFCFLVTLSLNKSQ